MYHNMSTPFYSDRLAKKLFPREMTTDLSDSLFFFFYSVLFISYTVLEYLFRSPVFSSVLRVEIVHCYFFLS